MGLYWLVHRNYMGSIQKKTGTQLAWLGSASTDLRITLIQVSDKLISCDVQIAC